MADTFYYHIQSAQGRQEGLIEANSKRDAEMQLRQQGFVILKLEIQQSKINLDKHNIRAHNRFFESLQITKAQQELFLQQLSAMLSGGVPILITLQNLAQNSPKPLCFAIDRSSKRLADGESIRTIFSEEFSFFGPVILGLLDAGQLNGQIDQMSAYAAELISKQRELRSKLIQALMYPAIVVLVLIGVVCFLVYGVFPKLIEFLNTKSATLPPITQLLFDIIYFIQNYGIYLVMVPIILMVTIMVLRRYERCGKWIDFSLLKIPILGKVLKSAANAMVSRVLGALLKSGINILDALTYTQSTTSNIHYQLLIKEVRRLISVGHSLSKSLEMVHFYALMPLSKSMVQVGESTGRLDESLLLISRFSEDDLTRRISFLSKMIEPVLFLVVGTIVGFVYIAFFMALMSVSQGGGN